MRRELPPHLETRWRQRDSHGANQPWDFKAQLIIVLSTHLSVKLGIDREGAMMFRVFFLVIWKMGKWRVYVWGTWYWRSDQGFAQAVSLWKKAQGVLMLFSVLRTFQSSGHLRKKCIKMHLSSSKKKKVIRAFFCWLLLQTDGASERRRVAWPVCSIGF